MSNNKDFFTQPPAHIVQQQSHLYPHTYHTLYPNLITSARESADNDYASYKNNKELRPKKKKKKGGYNDGNDDNDGNDIDNDDDG